MAHAALWVQATHAHVYRATQDPIVNYVKNISIFSLDFIIKPNLIMTFLILKTIHASTIHVLMEPLARWLATVTCVYVLPFIAEPIVKHVN